MSQEEFGIPLNFRVPASQLEFWGCPKSWQSQGPGMLLGLRRINPTLGHFFCVFKFAQPAGVLPFSLQSPIERFESATAGWLVRPIGVTFHAAVRYPLVQYPDVAQQRLETPKT